MITLFIHYITYTTGYSSVHVGRPQKVSCATRQCDLSCVSECVNYMICLETADMKIYRAKFVMNSLYALRETGFLMST